MMSGRKPGLIALFDVDGTLTAPRKAATPNMVEFMKNLRKIVTVGVVGGSDLVKISEQLGKTVLDDYDFVFSENGLVAHKDGKLIGTQSLKTHLGDEKLKEIINFVLHYIADLDIPIKRYFLKVWDKTYCLRYLDEFQEVHFFGDKTYKGGNDFEIFDSEHTVGHTVSSPEDTVEQCTTLFLANSA